MEEKYGRVSGCDLMTQSDGNELNQNALRDLTSTLHASVKKKKRKGTT